MYFDWYNFGIFGEIYATIDKFVFNGAISCYLDGTLPDLTSAQFANLDLVCSLLATTLTIFVIAIPFIVVWFVIKLLLGGR